MWFDRMKGVQLTKTNGPKVAKWIGGRFHEMQNKEEDFITVETNRGDVLVRIGDWVAQDPDGKFRIVRLESINIDQALRERKKKDHLKVVESAK